MKRGIVFCRLNLLLVAVFFSSCSSKTESTSKDRSSVGSDYGATASSGTMFVPSRAKKTPAQLYKEANVKKAYIPKGRYGRKVKRRMKPRYITIHSTQNYSPSADAWQHAKALNHGALRARKCKGGNRIGYLTWHYTVDQYRVVQHLPCNEQGEHADFDGPGNNYSIGIEMCENRGNSRAKTLDRTAKLTAWLMYKYKIPLRKVVPHYHWARHGLRVPHKNCPHYLMDNGRPGAKWQAYLRKINRYYKEIKGGRSSRYAPTPVRAKRNVALASQRSQTIPVSRSLPSPSLPRGVTREPRFSSSHVQSLSGGSSRLTSPKTTRNLRALSSTSHRSVSSHSNHSSQKSSPKKSKRKVAQKASYRYHTVTSKDTLYSLSRKYKTTVKAIQKANGMTGTIIADGRKLKIPRG